MRTEGQTHMTKLTVAFCNIANAPKNVDEICVWVCVGGGDFSYDRIDEKCSQNFCRKPYKEKTN
jgi:hypothetical protein